MKLGVKEFRERFSALAEGDEPVLVTRNGRIIGRFVPERADDPASVDVEAWAAEMRERRDRWRDECPDWRRQLAAIGLDEAGEPVTP